ncbi:MAG: acyltransferase family protein, partial [Acidimicrobiia bacterium]
SPVLHFWSLAVEEQFYLTWPLALAGLYLVSRVAGKRQWWALRAMIAVVAIASLAEALHFASTNVDRAYYGTDTRAYQLLAGALIALTPQLVARGRDLAGVARRGSPFVLGALVLVGSSLWDMSSISRGVFAVAATGVLIVGLERAPQGAAARALSWPKVAYLGRISYGTYLWHWPIVVILSQHTLIGSTVMFALTTVLSTVLAAISFHLLEHPIRASKALDLLSSRVIAIALCFSFVAGLLISPAVEALAGPSPDLSKLSITVPGVNPDGLRLLDWVRAATDIPPSPDCLGKSVSKCIVVRGTGKKILLMGDSLARMWIPAFTAIARKESLTLMVASHPGCPWWPPATNPGNRNSCALLRADWYHRLIPQFEPDIVFLGLRGLDAPGNTFWVTSPRTGAGDYRILKTPKAGYVVAQTSAGEQTLRTQAAGALQLLRRPGREVVILEPTPLAPDPNFNPLDCASSGKTDCSFRVRPGPTPIVQFYRTLARTPDVWSLDLNQLVCPRFEVCDPVVDDVLTRRDHTHITGTYSLALSNSLEALLQRERILGGP